MRGVHADAHAGGRAGERADGRTQASACGWASGQAHGQARDALAQGDDRRVPEHLLRRAKALPGHHRHGHRARGRCGPQDLLQALPGPSTACSPTSSTGHIDRDRGEHARAALARTGKAFEQGGLAVRIARVFDDGERAAHGANISLQPPRVRGAFPFDLLLYLRQGVHASRSSGATARCRASVRSDQLDYYLSFVFGGILSAYRQWIMMGGDTPIENVSSAASALVARGLSALERVPARQRPRRLALRARS
ncbi:MAG: hypothetical protein ACLTSX_02585 [Collinsella sp.]